MRAIVIDGYGGRDVMKIRDIDPPRPKAGEVLVHVRAASVNPVDWKVRQGQLRPFVPKAFPYTLGSDMAGVVERVGEGVNSFAPGDEVYAMAPVVRGGAYAEYAAIAAKVAARKPTAFSFEESAAVPLAGLTALQALRDKGELLSGQKVLVHGAAGGVGGLAVQIAKALGAQVTGVCSAGARELVSSLGADRVIDYRLEDFTRGTERYNVIFDTVAKQSFAGCARVLMPRGRYITTLPSLNLALSYVAAPLARFFAHSKRARLIIARPRGRDLSFLTDLADQGKLRAVIDCVFPLEQVHEAHARSEAGHAHGKIVLKI